MCQCPQLPMRHLRLQMSECPRVGDLFDVIKSLYPDYLSPSLFVSIRFILANLYSCILSYHGYVRYCLRMFLQATLLFDTLRLNRYALRMSVRPLLTFVSPRSFASFVYSPSLSSVHLLRAVSKSFDQYSLCSLLRIKYPTLFF